MKTQFGIFLMYPLVIGIAILSMSDKSLTNEIIKHQSSQAAFISNSSPVFFGPLDEQEEGLPDYINFKPQSVYLYSLAFVRPRGFISFKEALAFKESRGNYKQVNTLGYLGKYQFGVITLNHFGVQDGQYFLRSPKLQEKVFIKYLNYNHNYLSDYFDKYEGKTIGGVTITKSGMLAAAHLSGPGGVRKYLDSNGTRSSKDAYGTSVRHYLKKFAGYDVHKGIK
jgi:hypothetical protein